MLKGEVQDVVLLDVTPLSLGMIMSVDQVVWRPLVAWAYRITACDEHHPELLVLNQKLHALVTQTLLPAEPVATKVADTRRLHTQSKSISPSSLGVLRG